MKIRLTLFLLMFFCLGSMGNESLASNEAPRLQTQMEAAKKHFELGNYIAQSISVRWA